MKPFLYALPGLCMAAMVAACSPASETSTPPISDPVDTIYYNGSVIAMTGADDVYEAAKKVCYV